jgi:hypothetical protein
MTVATLFLLLGLQEYGGWAVSVVLAGVVVWMAKYIVTKLENKPPNAEQARVIREAEALRNKELYAEVFKDMTTKLTATITPLINTINDNTGDHEQLRKDLLDALHDQLVPLVAAVEAAQVGSVEMKAALEKFFNETSKEKNEIITELARQKDAVGKEAMVKMEALYAQIQGIFEKVIGAAATLKAVNDRLLVIEAKKQAEA